MAPLYSALVPKGCSFIASLALIQQFLIALFSQFQRIVCVNSSVAAEKAHKLFETTQGDNNPFTSIVNLLVFLMYL